MLFVCPADELGRVLGALHVRGPVVGLVLPSEVLIPARLLPALPAADEGLASREETPEIFRDPASRVNPACSFDVGLVASRIPSFVHSRNARRSPSSVACVTASRTLFRAVTDSPDR
jgi:hypothetical protein